MPIDDVSALQRWLQSTLLDPHGASAEEIARRIEPSAQMTAEERLGIYQRAYLARLVECLRTEFPCVRQALGEELFDTFAAGYLERHPSRSYTLNRLGENFAADLAATLPQEDERREWFESLVELAELEWMTSVVFDGPGSEQLPPLDPTLLSENAWSSLRFELAPDVRLKDFRYPVHEYYRTLRAEVATPPPAARVTHLVIHRRDYTVSHEEVPSTVALLLAALATGQPLLTALQTLPTNSPDPDSLASHLHTWFTWFATERILVPMLN